MIKPLTVVTAEGIGCGMADLIIETNGETGTRDLCGGSRLFVSRQRRRSGRRSKCPLIKLGKQFVLRVGDSLGAAGGDFGGCPGLLNGAFRLGGEEGAIALGLSVALGYSCGDAGSMWLCRRGTGDRRGGGDARLPGVTGAMGSEALGHLLFEGKGPRGRVRFTGSFVQSLYVKLCRAHCAQT